MNTTPLRRAAPRLTLAAVLAAGLASCALIRHDSAPLAELPPQQIRLANDLRFAQSDWPSAHWWTAYGDAQLDALIDRALQTSPTLAAAKLRIAQARSDVELAQAGNSLQISALGAIDRERVSKNGFLGAYSGNDPAIGATGPWYTSGITGLGASLDIDLWGRQRALVEASLGVQNARVAETAAIELELSADIAQVYYRIQTTTHLIALLEQLSDIATFSVHAHDARAARGLESQTPAETARAQQLAAQREIVSARARVVQLRESLRALTGAGPDDLADIRPAPLPTRDATLPPTLSYELLARRPDLQAMRWYVQSSFDRIDAAKAAFYPSFDIKAFFGVNALHLGDLFEHASQQINAIPGLYLPIFDGGRLNANLNAARSASNTLVMQYNQNVLDAVRDVAIAGSRLQDLNAEAALQTHRIDAVSFARDSAAAHYARGLASRLDEEEAKAPAIREAIALLDLNGQRVETEITLTKELGGGYRSPNPVALKPR